MAAPDRADARTAIENLLFSYAGLIDAGDFGGIGDLFARARMLDPTGQVIGTGRDEVKAIYDRATKVYENGTPMTQHATTNVILTFGAADRTAKTRSRFSVMQALPDFPLQFIIAGDYEDEFACDDSNDWYFTSRQMKPKLIGDLSHHLRFDLASA